MHVLKIAESPIHNHNEVQYELDIQIHISRLMYNIHVCCCGALT